jgi:hypothetical protein
MSTLIGQRERIAVEFDLWPADPATKKWLYGTMCLWVDGKRIGRHDEQCAMTVGMAAFPYILLDAGRRRDDALMAAPAEQAFNTLYDALYGGEVERTDEEIDDLSRRYAHFEVLPGGFDVFDGWVAFLIEDRMVARLLWRSPDDVVHEARIGAGEFDRMIDGFLTELERQSGTKRKPPER